MKRLYKTGNYFKQIMLCNCAGVEIVDFTEQLNGEKSRDIISFEFAYDNIFVNMFLNDYRDGKYKDAQIENFDELKQKRKEMIREYLESLLQ